LISDAGRAFDGFDAVVIATPAPQAVPLLAGVPDLAARVAGVEMQPCHAAMVAFAEPLGVDFGGAFVSGSPLSWIANNETKPGRPGASCWVLHTNADWSARHLDVAPDLVVAALLDALGDLLERDLPPTSHRASHLWRFARSDRPLGDPFLWDPTARIGVAGDWNLGSRMEDAFRSGDLLAGAMLGAPVGLHC
jgi:predicted NAD/FAD-dependent oxidoreductase